MSKPELKSESKKETLQKEFLSIVNAMKESNTPLPDDFKLYYNIIIRSDRYGNHIKVTHHLTKSEAYKKRCGRRAHDWKGGKYGHACKYYTRKTNYIDNDVYCSVSSSDEYDPSYSDSDDSLSIL